MQIQDLPTPSALIDLKRLKINTERMIHSAQTLGVKLRPHVKTHKTLDGARYQTQDHFGGGITVSTLAEAEFYGEHGFQDVTYAVPLTPNKVKRALQLSRRIPAFQVLIDSLEMGQILGQMCSEQQQHLSVLIKIDCGYGRAGLRPTDPNLLTLAQHLHTDSWIHFEGLLTHAGHSYSCRNVEEIKEVAREEYHKMIQARDALHAKGIPTPTVSLGSTPTATVFPSIFDSLEGITEMRPGNYIFFDLFQASIGSCKIEEIALSVLSEVIAYYPHRNEILIDAGALALSKDLGAHQGDDALFGRVCTVDYQEYSHLSLIGLSQEHGKIKVASGFDWSQIQIGIPLRILPNHSCLVSALYDRLYVVEGEDVLDEWKPVRGW